MTSTLSKPSLLGKCHFQQSLRLFIVPPLWGFSAAYCQRLQADDFGSEVIPGAKDMGMHIQAYLYDGYWEDIGTVEAFYEANLALTDEPVPKFR